LAGLGHQVSGCDPGDSAFLDRAVRLGVERLPGQHPGHLDGALDALVRSTAVPEEHAEVVAARRRDIPIFRRGTALAGLLEGRPGVAVAGVARPDDFFDQTGEAGARLVDAIAFPDHHDYTRAEAQALGREAAGRPLVTTAKDAVKLAALLPDVELWVLDQDVTFESGRKRLTRAVDEVVK
ncbi:MAG: tetraacyldisaccharide 4'-kinase, partial [Gemmatimonadota bacterium]